MKKANPDYTVNELCLLFQFSERTYYAQFQQKPVNHKELSMITTIKSIADETGHTYGKRRMRVSLEHQGLKLGIHKTRTLMRKALVVAITPKKKHYYPNTGKTHVKATNILARQFSPKTMNTHWVGDITYVSTYQGWSYLASVLDLATKEIVGWSMSRTPNAELVKEALSHAILRQQPDTTQLLFHSDQGTQYSAKSFIDYLGIFNINQSMSRRGNCWDNSVMERFFRSLKSERLNHISFMNHPAAVSCIESYIYFYNYKRLHSSLGYITPAQKSAKLKKVA
jgi:transposase InsO family protein